MCNLRGRALRKYIVFLILCFTITNILSIPSNAENNEANISVIKDFNVYINCKNSNFSNIISFDNKLLLPLYEFLPQIGIVNDGKHIIWDKDNNKVIIYINNKEISLQIGDRLAYVDKSPLDMDVAPMLYNNIPYISISIAEIIGMKCVLDDKAVFIRSLDEFTKVKNILESAYYDTKKYSKYSYKYNINKTSSNTASCCNINSSGKIDTKKSIFYEYKIGYIGSMPIKSEAYYKNNTSYYKGLYDANWQQYNLSKDSYDSVTNSIQIGFHIKLTEIDYAALSIKEDLKSGVITFEGSVNSILDSNSLKKNEYQVNSSYTKIYIQKSKNIIYKIDKSLVYDQNISSDNVEHISEIHDYVLDDFDGSFEVEPEHGIEDLFNTDKDNTESDSDLKGYKIYSVKGYETKIKVLDPTISKIKYENTFVKKDNLFIAWDISLVYPEVLKSDDLDINIYVQDPSGNYIYSNNDVFKSKTKTDFFDLKSPDKSAFEVKDNKLIIRKSFGCGGFKKEKWKLGVYKVKIEVNNKFIGCAMFRIVKDDAEKVKDVKKEASEALITGNTLKKCGLPDSIHLGMSYNDFIKINNKSKMEYDDIFDFRTEIVQQVNNQYVKSITYYFDNDIDKPLYEIIIEFKKDFKLNDYIKSEFASNMFYLPQDRDFPIKMWSYEQKLVITGVISNTEYTEE
jgi:hypothetical protein